MINDSQTERVTSEILKAPGPFASLYLPYGVSGDSEKKCALERKNTMAGLSAALEGDGFAGLSKRWSREIKGLVVGGFEDQLKQRPLTVAVIFTAQDSWVIGVPGLIQSHHLVGDVPAIEPLAYFSWMNQPFQLVVVDQHEPQFFRGDAFGIKLVEPKIPDFFKEVFGESMVDFKLAELMQTADLADVDDGKIDRAPSGSIYGLKSRYDGHKGKQLKFWMKLIGEIAESTLDHRIPTFLCGTDASCRKFSDLKLKLAMRLEPRLHKEDLNDRPSLVREIDKILIAEKVAAVEEQMSDQALVTDFAEMAAVIERGQARSLLIEERSSMTGLDNLGIDNLGGLDQRTEMISRAFRQGVRFDFIRRPIKGRSGLAVMARG